MPLHLVNLLKNKNNSSTGSNDFNSCSGSENNQCLLCNSANNRIHTTDNKCVCKEGYFENCTFNY